MSVVSGSRPTSRGTILLLGHCALIERLKVGPRRSAKERLEAKLGSELTRELLGSLCADRPAPCGG